MYDVFFFTTTTLRTAVTAWCSNAASAEATYGHISGWDTSQVEDMSRLFDRWFSYCGSASATFNEDLSAWDVSSVTTMSSMFYYAYAFNQPLDGWNVSSVVEKSSISSTLPS